MEKPTKLQENELKELQQFNSNTGLLIQQLGKLQLAKFKLESDEAYLKNQLELLNESELKISKDIKEKYGNIEIDINTGDITYSKE